MNRTLRSMIFLAAVSIAPWALGCSSSGGNGGGGGNGDGGSMANGDGGSMANGDGGSMANGDGGSTSNGDGGSTSNGDGGPIVPACGTVTATIRDFKFWDSSDTDTLPDFENVNHDEPDWDFSSGSPMWTANPTDWSGCDVSQAYLDTSLDAEGKPQFLAGVDNSPCNTIQTANGLTGAEGFYYWYRDSHFDMNTHFTVEIPNQAGTGTCAGVTGFCFDAANLPGVDGGTGGQWFPIDNEGWGNQGTDHNGVSHNFSFTTEIAGTFQYNGGETFTFSGDDDVWVFVNGKLAVDIGGVHGKQTKTIDFDSEATYLGLVKGGTYSIHLFHAERHTHASNFRFETTISCLHLG